MRRVGLIMGRLKRGGAEMLVLSMLRHPPAGVQYHLFLLRGGGDLWTAATDLGIPITPLRTRGPLIIPLLAVRLAGQLRRARIDLLHSHMPRPGIVGRLGARLAGVPSCYTEHNLWQAYDAATLRWHRRTLGLERRIFVVSRDVRASLLAARPDLEAIVETIHNAIDLEEAQSHRAARDTLRASIGLSADGRLLVNVANMRATKNQALLLRAFAEVRRQELRPLRLAILGRDLGMRADLERLAAELGIAQEVLFLGLRQDALDWMGAADLFVSSSDVEGLPMTLLEAGALEMPVVCTDAGGVNEVVEEGTSERLVPPGDLDRLASAMLEMLRSPDTARRLGSALRARVESDFSLAAMMARYARGYAAALG